MAHYDVDRVKAEADIAQVIGQFVKLQRAGTGELTGLCPFHKEKTPSFTVTPSKGVFYCFGCQASGDVISFVTRLEGLNFQSAVRRVAEMVGMRPEETNAPRPKAARTSANPAEIQPRVVATYEYRDEEDFPLYEVQRVEPGRNGKAKEFRQRRRHPIDGAWVWGISEGVYRKSSGGDWYPVKEKEIREDDDKLPEVRRVLYRLSKVLASSTVFVVEGEKDVHSLEENGFAATTNSGGASQKWLPEYTQALAGRRVVVIPDGDEPGLKRGAAIVKELTGKASDVVYVKLPEGKDATEYLQAGHTGEDLMNLVEETRRERIREQIESRGLLHPTEILDLFEGGINAFLDPGKRKKGTPTGFTALDEMTLGLHEGELVILAARPAMGKTALALNIAAHVAEHGETVGVFSLEMSRESLLTRLVCARARVDQMRFRAGYLGREDRTRLATAFDDICGWPLFIDDQSSADLKTIHRKVTALKARYGLGLVVIDYLQLMRAGKGENRNLEVGALSRGLKLMSRELKVPFLVLSQLSRAPEARPGNHRPQLSDLRESGSLEQDCDVCMFIFREEVYKPDREDLRGIAEIIVAKQRNGPTGTRRLAFMRELTKFENLARDSSDGGYDE